MKEKYRPVFKDVTNFCFLIVAFVDLVMCVAYIAPDATALHKVIVLTIQLVLVLSVARMAYISEDSVNNTVRYITVDRETGEIVPNDSDREIRALDAVKSKDKRYRLVTVPNIVYMKVDLDTDKYDNIEVEFNVGDTQKYLENNDKDTCVRMKQADQMENLIRDILADGTNDFKDRLNEKLDGTGLSVREYKVNEIIPYVL